MSKKVEMSEEEKASSWADLPSFKEFMKGLRAPHSSGEYKRAMLAVDRLKAPVIAILLPILAIISLIVITATTGSNRMEMQLEIARVETEPKLEDPDEEPPPDTPDMSSVEPDAESRDVSVDMPTPTPVEIVAAPTLTPSKTVQALNSPVRMANIIAGPKMASLGGGSPFGVKVGGDKIGGVPPGYMIGEMFDFKRDASGKEIEGWGPNRYWEQARKVINNGKFGPEAETEVYKVPARVALSKIWVPTQKAENGPNAFGVGDKMKPRGWMAHYSANLEPKVSGKFRFIGDFDDFMACFINGKLVLEANWGVYGDTPASVSGWKSPVGKSPYGIDVVGDWFVLKKGETIRVDICIGERPGGLIGGRLMIEQEGVEYEKDGDRPIWPLFTSRRLSFREQEDIIKNNEKKGNFKFAREIGSLFQVRSDDDVKRQAERAKRERKEAESVSVEVDI